MTTRQRVERLVQGQSFLMTDAETMKEESYLTGSDAVALLLAERRRLLAKVRKLREKERLHGYAIGTTTLTTAYLRACDDILKALR